MSSSTLAFLLGEPSPEFSSARLSVWLFMSSSSVSCTGTCAGFNPEVELEEAAPPAVGVALGEENFTALRDPPCSFRNFTVSLNKSASPRLGQETLW